jgi:hypothetical protein
MKCPKCGFQQDEGLECFRCGIIFARYHAGEISSPSASKTGKYEKSERSLADLLRGFYRIFRWISLIGIIVVIALILRNSPPPEVAYTPETIIRAEAKVQAFQASAQQGGISTLELDESELAGWLDSNLEYEKSDSASPPQTAEDMISLTKRALNATAQEDPEFEQVNSSVRDVKIELLEDSLQAHMIFNLHGMDLSMDLAGRLVVRDGYLRLEPTGGKLGSLPLTAGTLRNATERLFESPKNKEKFRLPPHIHDVRIERGRLLVSSK